VLIFQKKTLKKKRST